MGDFSSLKVARELPPTGGYTERAEALFEGLCGATIVEIGAPDEENTKIEGGGLIIDFIPKSSDQVRRAIFGFNDRGMWVEYDGPITPSP